MSANPETEARLSQVVQAIRELSRERRTPPTVRELATHLARTVGGVHKDLYSLRSSGRVEWEARKPRTLRVVRRKR